MAATLLAELPAMTPLWCPPCVKPFQQQDPPLSFLDLMPPCHHMAGISLAATITEFTIHIHDCGRRHHAPA